MSEFKIDNYRELTQVTTLQDTALGIMRWGRNNAFPQTLKNLIKQSASASPAVKRTAKFYKGAKFEGENVIVNEILGLTLRKVVDNMADELAYFGGFALHTNYNANIKVSSISPALLTDYRFNELDELNFSSKLGYHQNFGLNSEVKKTIDRTATSGNIKWFNRFNPGMVEAQLEEVGGDIRKYNGQILYYSNAGYSKYPEPQLQAPINYLLADVENSVLVRKESSTGFLNSYLLKTMLNAGDPNLDSLENAIASAQGARGSGKIITMSGLSNEELENTLLEEIGGGAGASGAIIESADKAYRLCREVLLGAYMIPPILGGVAVNTGFSTKELEDAYFVFNAITEEGRNIIESELNRILAESNFPIKEIKLQPLKLNKDEENTEQK